MRSTWVLLVAAQAWGCTNLADIEAGVCGNGVEESTEDCDSTSAGCRPPGSENACRFDCSADVNGVRRACPAGYGCGLADDVCRAHSGGFEPLASPATGDTFYIATADFDADQRDDVLSVELNTVGVHFSAADGESDQSATLYSPPFEPAIGRFSDAGGAGFALASGGISVQRGREDHTLSAGAYAPFPVAPDTVAMGVFDAKPATYVNDVQNLGSEVVSFAPIANSLQVRDVIKSQDLFTLDVSQTEVTNEVIHADLDFDIRPGEELIVPKPGTDTILIFGMSSLDVASSSYLWNDSPLTSSLKLEAPYHLPVQLPAVTKPAPPTVVVGYVNGDEFPDIVALGGSDGEQRMMIALGDGNGQFYSQSSLLDAKLPDNRLAPFVPYNLSLLGGKMVVGQPLAVADLNGDGIPDFVVENGINLSVPGGSGNLALWFGVVKADLPWHAAAIGNFNGDTFPDVVAATHDGRRVDLHVGTKEGFNTTHISTNSKVSGFATGDFDGNLIGDVAVTETVTLADGAKEDVLLVLFGRVGGPLEAPVELGRFEKIRQIQAGNVTAFTGALDSVSDIGVLAMSGDAPTAALFVGDTQRRIESPFSITHAPNTPDEALSYASRVRAGNFDGVGPNDDLAVLTTPPAEIPGVDGETRLWLVPASGDAELSLATSRESAAIENHKLKRCGMMFAALDLGGDELDELVVLGFFAEEGVPPTGQLIVAHSVAAEGLHHFEIDPAVEVPEAYIGRVAVLSCDASDYEGQTAEGLPLDGQVQVIDVNGDGHEDLLSLAILVQPPPSAALESKLVLFVNRYDGQLDVAGRVTLDIEGAKPDARPRSFVVTQLDADPEPEIVLILGDKPFRGEIDLAQHRIVNVTSLEGLPQGNLLSTGDLNGDGVEDLVVAGSSGVNLVRGVPVLR